MANQCANTTEVKFGGVKIPRITRVTPNDGGQKVKVTSLDSAREEYEDGKPDLSTTVEVIGPPGLARGAKGDLIVTWPDGTTSGSIYNAMLADVQRSGALNSPVTSTYAFVGSVAAGS